MSLKAIKKLSRWFEQWADDHGEDSDRHLSDEVAAEITALEAAAADIQAETDAADGDTSDREMRRYLSAMALLEAIAREAK